MELSELMALSYEDLAHALYLKGKADGYSKITDKTQWREMIMADTLNHIPHTKISAGADSDAYGSDAFDPTTNTYAEYKTTSISDDDLNSIAKLLGMPLPKSKKTNYKPTSIGGVYNGAYKQSAIDAYSKIDHYFAIFFEEVCVLIAKIPTETVIEQLTANNANRKVGATTNLSTVSVPLTDAIIYYDNLEHLKKVKING